MSHASVHADAVAVLTGWDPPVLEQLALREAFLGFLAARSDATARSCEPGHLTASAIVFDAAGSSVLLTLHKRLGRWLQVGGHCEDGDETMAGAALREATEESGIEGLQIGPGNAGAPVHLDVHGLTCSLGRPTRHFDIRYRIVAPEGAVAAISSESDDVRFFPLDALPELDASTLAAIAAARR